ncbi:hypothetical protein P4H39_22450 [Paenibacillus lautus]|uniref:hypothetical protein n=1 Tax=Paenibacillus lautus TaxID=1401 RepID=UPI002DBEF7B9|nr:hypothetical protein [Paenibacillus lautus]MEC0205372.1 hypothetical protein [Paenibacillus lautus]
MSESHEERFLMAVASRSGLVWGLRVRIVPPIAVVAEFLDCILGVEIRLQRRTLRFSGIDSSSPLLRS